MRLADIVDRYADRHPYGLSPGSVEQLRWSIRGLEHFCGRTLDIADLTDERVNLYLGWLARNRSPDTARTRRGNLLTIWRFAYMEGLVGFAPRCVRRLRPVCRRPRAWTCGEVLRVIHAAELLGGCFRGTRLRRAAYMGSLVRAGYDTALRLGDLLRLRGGDVRQGRMLVRQHKTGRDVAVRLRDATLEAIRATLADQPRRVIWPLWARREALYRLMREIVRDAGLDEGTFRWLRRSAITQVERLRLGAGTQLAGHRSRQTTERWYLDTSQLAPPPLPPLTEPSATSSAAVPASTRPAGGPRRIAPDPPR